MLKVHHVNIVSPNLAELDTFYREVMEMQSKPGLDEGRKEDGYNSGGATWVTDGVFEFHLAVPNYNVAFDTGQSINPVHRGHVAFRTDDIEGFKKRLEERGIPYADFGRWAMKGWYQIFFHDPAGTVVEVNQIFEE